MQVKIDSCIDRLMGLKSGGQHMQQFKEQLVHGDDGKTRFEGCDIAACPESDVQSAVNKFIDSLINNIKMRFPDSELLVAFGVLGMRPITFISASDLDEWGNSKLQVLLDHFAKPKTHAWKTGDGEEMQKESPALIDAETAKDEWVDLKKTVKEQMYPRDSTLTLWQLIARYHQLEFTNLKKLAQLALTLPVYTADVERGFSTQNTILTSQRNRLTAENQAMLMRVQMEGPRDVKGESEWVFRAIESLSVVEFLMEEGLHGENFH
ncbi:uncharacterized protein LOC143280686 [Babylonia areolata]|uniref:uncharacterized protein LOC143280686 n=1 Tax=Babylonia areolata TaxID=304850 RepID=UPI003FD1C4B0